MQGKGEMCLFVSVEILSSRNGNKAPFILQRGDGKIELLVNISG